MKTSPTYLRSSFLAIAFALGTLSLSSYAEDASSAEEPGIIEKTVSNIKGLFSKPEEKSDVTVAIAAETAGADAVEASIRAAFARTRPDLEIESVTVAELPGLFAVQFERGPLVYASADGRFFVAGELYENTDNGMESVAERKLMPERAALLSQVKRDDMIIFSPEGETKASLYVFTDVDCGYCQKLHREVPELNAKGIEVRYLAYPRAGFQSPTFARMVSAWCADDREEAMNILKSRGQLDPKTCENPIVAQFQLGNKLGVTGTPAIVTESGQLIPGYRPADQLAAMLGQ